MQNLETLGSSITVREAKSVFDGNDLKMNIINYISKFNNFTFGIHPINTFYTVREVPLFNERPFKHEFLLPIAQSFPFLKNLCVRNGKSIKNVVKQSLNILILKNLILFVLAKITMKNSYSILKRV